jgi:hypothetical protein
MSTRKKFKSRKSKYNNSPNSNSGIPISLTTPVSHGSATMNALRYKSYKPLVTEETRKQQIDLERRIINNNRINAENASIDATWTNVTPLPRVKTLRNCLDKLKGGRKRNSTKKKRHSKTKKRGNKKNQRK